MILPPARLRRFQFVFTGLEFLRVAVTKSDVLMEDCYDQNNPPATLIIRRLSGGTVAAAFGTSAAPETHLESFWTYPFFSSFLHWRVKTFLGSSGFKCESVVRNEEISQPGFKKDENLQCVDKLF